VKTQSKKNTVLALHWILGAFAEKGRSCVTGFHIWISPAAVMSKKVKNFGSLVAPLRGRKAHNNKTHLV
jgi:hypothetical protein